MIPEGCAGGGWEFGFGKCGKDQKLEAEFTEAVRSYPHLAYSTCLDVLELSSFQTPIGFNAMQKEAFDMSLQLNVLLHAQLLNVQELPSIQASNKILA